MKNFLFNPIGYSPKWFLLAILFYKSYTFCILISNSVYLFQ